MYNVFTVKSTSDWQLPQKSCLINFSLLKEIYSPAPFRSFSIKYVCFGSEKYFVNGNHYNIESGQYLLANHFSEGFVEINKTVKGICIDVAPEVLSQVVASYLQPDTPFSDIMLDTFFNSAHFLENKYNGNNTYVGQLLRQLDAKLSENPHYKHEFTPEFYYTLAEKIVADHIPIYKQLQTLKTLKSVTQKDLLRRVSRGKEFIDSYFKHSLQIETIAKEANLSEYHFFRIFKTVFGISPYQYMLQKRLLFSKEALQRGSLSISDVALEVGFADIHAFSKAFKGYFGVAPSKYHKN